MDEESKDRGTLRARGVGDREMRTGSGASDRPIPNAEGSRVPVTRRREGLVRRVGREWDTLFWVVAGFAVLYFSEFATTLIFNDRIKGWWLHVSIASYLTCGGCLMYAFAKRKGLHPNNWQRTAPVLVPIATIAGIAGSVSLAVAVWPVWRYYTFPILFTLFMGFVSSVSLLGL